MKRTFREWAMPWLACLAFGMLAFLCLSASPTDKLLEVGTRSALDLDGHPAKPLNSTNLATVLVFVGVDCPISNKYSPEIRRLRSLFEKRNIAFWMVYPDGDVKADDIRKHVQAFDLGDRILRDPDHVLVKIAQATVTPEVAVFDRNRVLAYRGRIDDRFVALGKERSQATRKDLEINLNLLVNGQPITRKRTKSIGCQIPDLN